MAVQTIPPTGRWDYAQRGYDIVCESTNLLVPASLILEWPWQLSGDPEGLLMGWRDSAYQLYLDLSRLTNLRAAGRLSMADAAREGRLRVRGGIEELRYGAKLFPNLTPVRPISPAVELANARVVAYRLTLKLSQLLNEYYAAFGTGW